jgi:glycosyltransferase involved in cell wall biosynthesis
VTLRIAVCVRRISFGEGIGGMERAAADHIEWLLSGGVQVTLIAPRVNVFGQIPGDLRVVDIAWPRWNNGPGRPTFAAAYGLWIRRVVQHLSLPSESAYSAVHYHGAAAHAINRLRNRSGGSAHVVNPHGMEEFGRLTLRTAPNRLILRKYVRAASGADAVIATDSAMVETVLRNLRVPRSKVPIIPNSVDSELLRRLALGAHPNDRFTIVTVGRIVANKGYDLLLEALVREDVRQALPSESRWVHFGDGAERSRLEARSSVLAMPFEVRSRRPDSEVQQSLSVADLFVQPSRYEGSSLTTLEAMAHGRTIVATAVGGIPDKIIEGETGFLAQPTSDSLAAAIIRARSSGPTGANARRLVDADFSRERSRQLYMALYQSLTQPN